MNYTNVKLKQALAKMLLTLIESTQVNGEIFLLWKAQDPDVSREFVQDTELLHLCWMVEDTIKDKVRFVRELYDLFEQKHRGNEAWDCLDPVDISAMLVHATWQQRVIALAKVKGVEIV